MNATPDPIVSIVMPAYNSAKFIVQTVQSMLTQTLRDFEFIVVNDGSTDDTLKILQELAQRDPRIQVVDEGKRGFVGSLNRGCALARGTYIARMDADDISLPQRLEKQVQFLETHPHISLCGTWAYAYSGDHTGASPILRFPQTPAEVRCARYFFPPCVIPPSCFGAAFLRKMACVMRSRHGKRRIMHYGLPPPELIKLEIYRMCFCNIVYIPDR